LTTAHNDCEAIVADARVLGGDARLNVAGGP